jgi:hypothetical protein
MTIRKKVISVMAEKIAPYFRPASTMILTLSCRARENPFARFACTIDETPDYRRYSYKADMLIHIKLI